MPPPPPEPARRNTTPAEFTNTLKAAITAKDVEKLDALVYADGASPEDIRRITDLFRLTLMPGIEDGKTIHTEPLKGKGFIPYKRMIPAGE